MVAMPASLCGVLLAALWSMRRGKDLDKDTVFQERLKDPEFAAQLEGQGQTLIGKTFPPSAYRAVWIFFTVIILVVILGAFESLRPSFPDDDGAAKPLSMNLVIQMLMLVGGAIMLIACKVNHRKIASTAVFKASMTAVFSVFGVAWMADTFFSAHLDQLTNVLGEVVAAAPWTYALALLITSKLVNSQGAALVAIAPIGLALGVDPVVVIGFYGAAYGYWILPTYPSDLACIGFDTTETTRIGKFVINHSFLIPGAIGVFTSCVVGSGLAQLLL